MIDAVLSYHMNTATCGVAKFNHALAKRLGVPCLPLCSPVAKGLVSIKASEMGDYWNERLPKGMYDLLLHDVPLTNIAWLNNPRRLFAGNALIADLLRPYRQDVIEAFCPSTVEGNATRGAYRVLVFGMAHKLLLPHFEALKAQLDAEHPDYTVELSTAVHEGSPWDVALTDSTSAMRAIFGDRLRVLGFLGDDALAKELQDVDAVAAFYQPALRANNTTYWAAVEAGKRIFTNRDAYSPKDGDPPASWDRLLEILRA